jgi:hypothetical protein
MSKLRKHSRFLYWRHSVYTTLLITHSVQNHCGGVHADVYKFVGARETMTEGWGSLTKRSLLLYQLCRGEHVGMLSPQEKVKYI